MSFVDLGTGITSSSEGSLPLSLSLSAMLISRSKLSLARLLVPLGVLFALGFSFAGKTRVSRLIWYYTKSRQFFVGRKTIFGRNDAAFRAFAA